MHAKHTFNIGDQAATLEMSEIARQVSCAVRLQFEYNFILATVFLAKEPKPRQDSSLAVDYFENICAVRCVLGSYFRRDGQRAEKETVTSRLIVRSIRPRSYTPDGMMPRLWQVYSSTRPMWWRSQIHMHQKADHG